MRFGLLVLLFLAGAANAEVFDCQSGTHWSANGEIVVIASTGPGDGWGSIVVAGKTYVARYRVTGFDRRWDFDQQDDGAYNYMFKIQPDGSAGSIDFSQAYPDEVVNASRFLVRK